MKLEFTLSFLLSVTSAQTALVPLYGQCGGLDWIGATKCAPGGVCTYVNSYYSCCFPPSSSSTTQTPTPTPTSPPTKTPTPSSTKTPVLSSTKTSTSVASATPTQVLVPLYGQCGGLSWTGATKCAPGGVCTYVNPYYSCCFPPSSSSTTPTPTLTPTPSSTKTSTSVVATSTEVLAPLYAQCGGQSFVGPTKCVPGATCVYENPYFSNCFATTLSSSSATATPAVTARAVVWAA